ncbi:MAG: trypsin-like peptidase domain-containing protein, partial [Nanoarchaeota archaeon]
GERVIAIGNPLGLQFSVTEGIVSGIHRPGINELEAYVQTDAALNPGNSGGPLINKNGKVIGINNFKIGSGESLGFALESNYIKDAVNAISLENLEREILS